VNKDWIFCTPLPVVLRTHLSALRKPRHTGNTKCGSLLRRVETEETDYKNVFLEKDRVPSKHGLPLPNTVAGVTVLWLFVQTFSKPSFPELRNLRRNFTAVR